MGKEFNIKAAAANLKKRVASKNKYRKELLKKAEADCKEIIKMIINKYNPERIYQWGSLLHPDRFKEYSDIDLAVEGITRADVFFGLLGEAMRLTRFSLDIVQIEKIEPEFAETIRKTGKVIYERT